MGKEFIRSDDYQPRLSVEISEDQFNQLQHLLPRGLKGQVFRVIIDDLIKILTCTTRREAVLAAILSRMVNIPAISLEDKDEPSSNTA